MLIAKQMEVRSNIKKYFDLAYEGDTVIVPRKENKNVVIISEAEYSRLSGIARLHAYASNLGEIKTDAPKSAAGGENSSNVKSDNMRKLDVIAGLQDGWNGNGAAALDESLITIIRNLLNELIIQPEIFPTALGTIQLEYDNARRDHMEIEIGQADRAEIFVVMYNGKECFDSVKVTPDEVNRKVLEFYE